MAAHDLCGDILSSCDALSVSFVDLLTAQVDAGLETGLGDCLCPAKEISRLLGQQSSALFLVEKQNRLRREALSHGRRRRRCSVAPSKASGILAVSLDLCVELAISEHEEAEALCPQHSALANPRVLLLARRICQPVAGEIKVLLQGGKQDVSWIVIAIEADKSLRMFCVDLLGTELYLAHYQSC